MRTFRMRTVLLMILALALLMILALAAFVRFYCATHPRPSEDPRKPIKIRMVPVDTLPGK